MTEPTDMRLVTAEFADGIGRVSVGGELDLSNASTLRDAVRGLVDAGDRGVMVDLSETMFIDSTTLGVLMAEARRLRSLDGELAIVCSDRNVRRIFEITLLDRLFKLFETPDACLAYLREREVLTASAPDRRHDGA